MRLYVSLLILLLAGCLQAKSNARSHRSIDFNDVLETSTYGMQRGFNPINYQLQIQPSTWNATFKGRLRLLGEWTTDGSRIKLDADRRIHVTDVSVRCLSVNGTEPWEPAGIAECEHKDKKYNIDLEQWFNVGRKCELDLNYSGNISTSEAYGLFMNSYLDTNAKAHTFVATHLRSNNARKLFPCIDEPEYKATFQLSVIRPKNMIARANTPINSSTEVPGEPNFMLDHFEKTPEMSTYQLAFMIVDFESLSPTTPVNPIEGQPPLEIKVWGRKEYLPTLSKVPNKIVKIVNYLQNYFNVSIGLPKLDLVAMPMYTASKTSDNWGLMFFRESELSSPLVWNTAYELIYQWIGQRITPYRWSSGQINKALNSFLASKTTVDIDPSEMEGKWPMTLLYSIYYEFGKTLPFSRVAGIRHETTSAKTELLCRMFNYTLGEDIFRKGVQKLFHDEAKNRRFYTHDIFDHLDAVRLENNLTRPSGLEIKNIAAPWINRDRVPLVTVIRDYETGRINFTQNVFLREVPPASNAKMSYLWDIPIIVVSEDNLNFSQFQPEFWMTKNSPSMNLIDRVPPNKFLIVNPEEIGIFPVNYDICNWNMISNYLQGPNREKIPVLTRAKLLHDAWNLAYGGNFCFGVALNMTLFLKNETSHVVWEPFFTMIDHVGKRIQDSNEISLRFQAYIVSLLEPLYKNQLGEVAQPNEPAWKTRMRGMAKHFLCRAGYAPCVLEAKEQFKKWMKDDQPDEGNPVANEFICPVFRWGSMEEWEFGLQRVLNFPKGRKESERTYLIKNLGGCPVDKAKIERLLNVTILSQNSTFSNSDIQLVYSTLTGSTTGYMTLFEFIMDYWELMRPRLRFLPQMWMGLVNSTSSFAAQNGAPDLTPQLQAESDLDGDTVGSIMKKVMGDIDKELKWSTMNLPVIENWLKNHLDNSTLPLMSYSRPTTPSNTENE